MTYKGLREEPQKRILATNTEIKGREVKSGTKEESTERIELKAQRAVPRGEADWQKSSRQASGATRKESRREMSVSGPNSPQRYERRVVLERLANRSRALVTNPIAIKAVQ